MLNANLICRLSTNLNRRTFWRRKEEEWSSAKKRSASHKPNANFWTEILSFFTKTISYHLFGEKSFKNHLTNTHNLSAFVRTQKKSIEESKYFGKMTNGPMNS